MYLTKGKKLRVTMRLGQSVGSEMEKRTGFKFVRERCEHIVERELSAEQPIAKVMVCGPPRMNEVMATLMSKANKSHLLLVM